MRTRESPAKKEDKGKWLPRRLPPSSRDQPWRLAKPRPGPRNQALRPLPSQRCPVSCRSRRRLRFPLPGWRISLCALRWPWAAARRWSNHPRPTLRRHRLPRLRLSRRRPRRRSPRVRSCPPSRFRLPGLAKSCPARASRSPERLNLAFRPLCPGSPHDRRPEALPQDRHRLLRRLNPERTGEGVRQPWSDSPPRVPSCLPGPTWWRNSRRPRPLSPNPPRLVRVCRSNGLPRRRRDSPSIVDRFVPDNLLCHGREPRLVARAHAWDAGARCTRHRRSPWSRRLR